MTAHSGAGTTAALLLTRWWSRPTPDELGSWTELWSEADSTARSLELDVAHTNQLRTAAEQSDPGRLIDEYERLLVGPGRAPCAPYESLWRADVPLHEQEMLMSGSADAVLEVYRELGLKVASAAHELPDHLLVEWEAVAYALHNGATVPAAKLLRDHLALWMAPFCKAVDRETDEPFYGSLARLTEAWTAALAQ